MIGINYVNITVYSPQTGGDAVEGGLQSSRPGMDSKSIVRTLDDVRAKRSRYVTLAGDHTLYYKLYTIPTITYLSYESGSKIAVTLINVFAYVHDTGSAFTGKPEGRFDVAVGIDYTQTQINSQPFANYSSSGTIAPKIQLIPINALTIYSVVPGDGWYAIAHKLNVTINNLLTANNATTATVLHPGDKLAVPGRSYKVAAGDGWYAVAKYCGCSLMDVLTANSATIVTAIYPGQIVNCR